MMTRQEKQAIVDTNLQSVTTALNHYHLQIANGVVVSTKELSRMCNLLAISLEATAYVLGDIND